MGSPIVVDDLGCSSIKAHLFRIREKTQEPDNSVFVGTARARDIRPECKNYSMHYAFCCIVGRPMELHDVCTVYSHNDRRVDCASRQMAACIQWSSRIVSTVELFVFIHANIVSTLISSTLTLTSVFPPLKLALMEISPEEWSEQAIS